MDQIGHTDPGFTLRVYRHAMRRDQASRDQLKTLVGLETEPGDTISGIISGTKSGTNNKTGGLAELWSDRGQGAKHAV